MKHGGARAAAERVYRLYRDLRNQNEAFAYGESGEVFVEKNPDVARFRQAMHANLSIPERVLMIDLVTAIIVEEFG